jgi:2-iminoacetate synthase ThiH
MLPEALLVLDALVVRHDETPRRLIVGEVKTYPDRGGYTDTRELATARAQAGVYVHGLDLVLQETSLLPHSNSGTMSLQEMERLREVNVSMGVMLESISQRLCGTGGPHEMSTSKQPSARMKTIQKAGRLKISDKGVISGQ